MRKIVLSAIALLLGSLSAQAVTLKEALTNGYKNHEDLQIIRSNYLNEIEALPRALAGFMPRVSVGASISDSKTTRRSSTDVLESVSTTTSPARNNISLEQPIFTGGSSIAEMKAAQSSFRAAKNFYYAKEQEIIFSQINNYLTCAEAYEKYNISKISVKSNKKQLEAIREKFRLGESTETEVASAETGLAIAEANQALAYANLESARANFTKVFGIEAENIKMPAINNDSPVNLEEFTEISIANNPNILAAQHQTKISKAGEHIAKAALLPQVFVSVQKGSTHFNPQNTFRGEVNQDSITSTLSVNIPILARGGVEYSDVRKAKYNTKKSVIELNSQIKLIKANCKAFWESFHATKTRLDATIQGVKSAEVAYEGMMQEELLGSKTIIDVLDAEEKLNSARATKIEADKQLVLTYYQMQAQMGKLTGQALGLPVELFNPEEEFKRIKLKIIGY